ncbi:hypothetical protein Acsp02_54430 [Actinoplanes sp. NBRC 103695]|nr:hypothetical protein Acsp02_54430 [Actinoplanes sp. NBRC 103695]
MVRKSSADLAAAPGVPILAGQRARGGILALMRDGEPKPEEYSRVTNPGRFAVLRDAAEHLLDELTEHYTVERREAKEPLGEELYRTVRLVPRMPAAAPLAVAFTEFPSVVLKLGRWYEESLPNCGCDACDEQPDLLAEQLRSQASALVEGGLWERVRRGVGGSWSEVCLIGRDLNVRRETLLDSAEARSARREGFAAAVQWAPWPRRSAVA